MEQRLVAGNRQSVNDFFNYWCGLWFRHVVPTQSQLSNDLSNTANSVFNTIMPLTSNNSNGVGTMGQSADSNYQQSQMQDVMNKLDELINALRR